VHHTIQAAPPGREARGGRERTAMERQRRFRTTLGIFAVLGVLEWFTLGDETVKTVTGLNGKPLFDLSVRGIALGILVFSVWRAMGKAVDPATGEDLPANTQGEIVTRSACVMKGYFKMPKETATAIDNDSWLHTGDLGEWIGKNQYYKL